MSRFKSLKEISLKKKIFICFLVVAIVVAVVFVVIKFGFPDADTTRPYAIAYEVGSDSTSKNQIDLAFDFFDENCAGEQKTDSIALRNINSFYMARLGVDEVDGHSVDRLLLALSEVQDKNKLNKKIKKLESLKNDVEENKSDVVSYCKDQITTYKNSTSNYERISDYFSNFAKKYTIYLKNMRDFVDCLSEIVETSTTESVYSNAYTQFTTVLNNKRLSLCVDACEDKFVDGESEVVINAPSFVAVAGGNVTMFEQKNDALQLFVENKSAYSNKFDTILEYGWLDAYFKVLGTDEELTFVTTRFEKANYDEFKNFMQSLFWVKMVEYPDPVVDAGDPDVSGEGEQASTPNAAFNQVASILSNVKIVGVA